MTRAEVEADLPTFQLQLLDVAGRIVKHWDVTLRDTDPEADSDRTLVSLPDGPEGRTRITRLENVDTERCFSIVATVSIRWGRRASRRATARIIPLI